MYGTEIYSILAPNFFNSSIVLLKWILTSSEIPSPVSSSQTPIFKSFIPTFSAWFGDTFNSFKALIGNLKTTVYKEDYIYRAV